MLLLIGLALMFSSFVSHPRAVLGWHDDLNQEALLLATNNDRRAAGRGGLSLNSALSQAAQAKANDMVEKDYWSHVTPSGQQPWSFIVARGYNYQEAGENLAYGFTTADSVEHGWMHSPEHRDNILHSSYTEVGYGVAQSADFQHKGAQTVIVALYGLPAGASAASNHGIGFAAAGQPQSVQRFTALAPAMSGLIVGIVGTLAVLAVLTRHALAWRRLIKCGETFVLRHPWLDLVLVGIIASTFILYQSAGVIR